MSRYSGLILLLMLDTVASGQSRDAAGRGPALVPSEPIGSIAQAAAALQQPKSVASTPRRLEIKPSGDPIYIVEENEWDGGQWLTYRRPKVDLFSKDASGIALKGYDVISYLEKRDEKGSKAYAVPFGGVTWWFASEEHRRVFAVEPARFVPEYGGFCAYSVGKGTAASADPRVYAVIGGKLYLFFDPAAKAVWEQQGSSVAAADRNWPKLHR